MHRSLAIVGLLTWGFACSGGSGTPAASVVQPGADVQPGLEVLLSDSFHLVRDHRVGLVTNQGGVDAQGAHAVERLRSAGVNLVALFSPEHGFRGTAAPGEAVATSRDSASGLPIYSLYGRTSAPTDAMLAGVDLLLVDLPDVGARYYTYLSTTVEVMRAAARRGIPVIVLDRPNPIGGLVQGNVLDTAYRSFIGLLAVPMRHGMTLGEQALLARHDLGISGSLIVVPAKGWDRVRPLDETGLPFVRPSPNLASLESLFHYPGTCLFEGTNLSVGRGTDAAFRQVGAPWLDTAQVLVLAREAGLPGVAFSSVSFTPRTPGDGKYSDTLVAGIRLTVTDRATYDPTITAVTLLRIIGRTQPDRFRFTPSQFDRLAGGPALRQALSNGLPPAEITKEWEQSRAVFLTRSRPFYLYPEH
jgi:uncharacterized protein YbbC (DUF1343 family)